MSQFVRTVSGKMIEEEEEDCGGGNGSPPQQTTIEADEVFGNTTAITNTTNNNNTTTTTTTNLIDEIPEEQDDDDDDADEEEEQPEEDEEEDGSLEDDYEYEDEDDAAVSGFLIDHPVAAAAAMMAASGSDTILPTKIEEDETIPNVDEMTNYNYKNCETNTSGTNGKPKWRQPTAAAVNMSLRAETETSGGKRRLAQDLFRIMNQDTEEAGFSLRPSHEDSMDKWTIQLFQFDEESNLAKDCKVLGITNVELEMSFPDQYPFEPPFVRVLRPRFKRQTGFVMNGALCMELLTKDGWNPINDIESVIVSIRSLLVVGDGRLEAAAKLSDAQYQKLLKEADAVDASNNKRQKTDSPLRRHNAAAGGSYSVSEAKAAYDHLSDYHKKKGWDTSGWWAKKG